MWGDLDALGIVFYPRYYEWIDAASHIFFDALGFNLWNLMTERKLQFGMVEAGCTYFKPGRYQDHISIITGIETLEEKTVLLKHTIIRTPDQITLVEGREKRICLDIADSPRFKAIPIPPDILAALKKAMEP
jgi:YbgC/YbaW family acyl-CoA thioester hydrolase